MSALSFERQKLKGKFDRLWLQYPKSFDPLMGCLASYRYEKSLEILPIELKGKRVLDLACGKGAFTKYLVESGAEVDALDISSNALKMVKKARTLQAALPDTGLEDGCYDVIFFLDAIAYMEKDDERLVLSELQRLLHKDGLVVFSSPLDVHSSNAEEMLLRLFSTEFNLANKHQSHHLFFLKTRHFFQKCRRLKEACNSRHVREKELKNAPFIYRFFLKLCRFSFFKALASPIARWGSWGQKKLESNLGLCRALESLSHFCFPRSSLTHVIFLGEKRSLFDNETPFEEDTKDLYQKLYNS